MTNIPTNETYFQKLPTVKPFYEEIKQKHALSGKFTMRDFYRICKAENIKIKHLDLIDDKSTIFGQYNYSPLGELSQIYLKKGLPLFVRRFVAAHELGHYFLHREQIMDKSWHFESGYLQPLDELEIEANVFARIMFNGGENE